MKCLAVAALAVVFAGASARADGVGFRDISVEADGERMATALWYPTDGDPGETTIGPFTMSGDPQTRRSAKSVTALSCCRTELAAAA